jgi:hypothetical protein
MSVDLNDRESCERLLSRLPGATHVVFSAHQEHKNQEKQVSINLAMLRSKSWKRIRLSSGMSR